MADRSEVDANDLRALSRAVADFMDERDWGPYHAPKNVAAALAVEAAELQEIYLWRSLDDPADDRRADIEAEAADVAICLLNFANRVGFDLGAAVLRKLDDADRKYPAERVRGSMKKYHQYEEWEG